MAKNSERTYREYLETVPENRKNRSSYWRDYLYANERTRQTSSKAAIGNRRKRAVERDEMKFVPTYRTSDEKNLHRINTQEEKTANIRKNAKTKQSGYGTTRSVLEDAFKKKGK